LSKNTILVAIYAHPESYPPTLSAIELLAKKFDKVIVLFRANTMKKWTYPQNVELVADGTVIEVKEQRALPIYKKIGLFARFIRQLFRIQKKHQPQSILLYDSMAAFAWDCFGRFWKYDGSLWYHNHDKLETESMRKFSMNWLALKAEKRIFPSLDIFTLPANERQIYFPIANFKGQYFFLPNYPSLSFFKPFKANRPLGDTIKLVYQGAICAEHGLEEIIGLLPFTINGKSLSLSIFGDIQDSYRLFLTDLAIRYKVLDRLCFNKRVAYQDLPHHTTEHHIGIAINKPSSINYETAGTASNKIYEYAALGLPIIYYGSTHYIKHLAPYDWAFATDVSSESLCSILETISNNYPELSKSARHDFETTLNFESFFKKIPVKVQKDKCKKLIFI